MNLLMRREDATAKSFVENHKDDADTKEMQRLFKFAPTEKIVGSE